jgi:hypothetical protein
MLPVLRMSVQGALYQDSSNKMRQLQGTRDKRHSHLCSKIYFCPQPQPQPTVINEMSYNYTQLYNKCY